MTAIELRGLRKVYDKGREAVCAVDGLDLEVRRGEVFGLLGPNGAGKTTTVEICEGLLAPTSGDVIVLGRTWNDPDPRALRARIGVTLQQTLFFEKQTVEEVVRLFRAFYPEGGRSADECIDLLGLNEKRKTATQHLSGGQKQRLAVAVALVGSPDLLFLDEPTTGLDPQSRLRLWEVVQSFRAAGGTVLLTTHYMEEAARLCDCLAVVDHGKRIALGSPAELIGSLGGEHVVEIEAPELARVFGDDAEPLPGVTGVRLDGDTAALTVEAPHVTVPAVLDRLRAAELPLRGLTTRHASLEDVFVALTGRNLRDDE